MVSLGVSLLLLDLVTPNTLTQIWKIGSLLIYDGNTITRTSIKLLEVFDDARHAFAMVVFVF